MIRLDDRKLRPVAPPPDPQDAEPDVNFGGLIRLGAWGGAAAACLLVAALATRTETGRAQIGAAFGIGGGATEISEAVNAKDAEIEARRTAETIRLLSEDRDRLLARMTALERNYEDVTGSIGKLAAAPKPPAPEPVAAPAPPPLAEAAPAPLATVPAAVSAPAASPAQASPPKTVAPKTAAPEPEPVSVKAEFGVDIGGGPTLASLRNAWDRVRRNHASLVEGLRPVIAIRDARAGQVELRLVIGPIGNAAAAAKLCAALATAGLSCQPTMFEGQRLALR